MLVAAEFTIDDQLTVKGYHDPSVRWNGFATPIFKLEDIRKWLDQTAVDEEGYGFEETIKHEWIPDQNLLLVTPAGSWDDEYYGSDAQGLEGDWFAVGAFSWCWMEVTE